MHSRCSRWLSPGVKGEGGRHAVFSRAGGGKGGGVVRNNEKEEAIRVVEHQHKGKVANGLSLP